MADWDELVSECVEAIAESDAHQAIRATLERAVTRSALRDSLGSARAGLNVLHQAPNLTVLNVVWPPQFTLFAHDHRMWAAIGIYSGGEVNTFYRRQGTTLDESGGKVLSEGDVLLMGESTIHAVSNPAREFTGAIHVYGGDLLGIPRSQWLGEALEEHPYDADAVDAAFARAEALTRG